MTLMRYLSAMLAGRAAMVLLGLAALVQLMDLLDNAGDIFAAGDGAAAMARYSLWRLPTTIAQVLPIAMLAGALITWFGLVRNHEMVTMRAAGVTAWRLLLSVLPLILAAATLHFALIDRVIPLTEPRFAAWWEQIEARADAARDGAEPDAAAIEDIWMRTNSTIISVGMISRDHRRMEDVTFIVLDEAGLVQRRIKAAHAEQVNGGWVLDDVREIRTTGAVFTSAPQDRMPWPDMVSAWDVIAVAEGSETMSIGRIEDILGDAMPGTRSDAHYRTMLHHNIALILASPLMILLSMPAAYGSARLGGAGFGFFIGFGLGLAYLVVDGMLISVGRAGVLPPPMAAWTAPLLFACIGGWILVKLEEP